MTEPRLELKTVAVREDGCFSAICWDGRPIAVSVERTFDDGRPIIQNGDFECTASFYIKGNYWTFEIAVPGHTRVLFHTGNKETDSLACVVVGEQFGILDGVTAVLQSGPAFTEFTRLTAGLKRFTMRVSGR